MQPRTLHRCALVLVLASGSISQLWAAPPRDAGVALTHEQELRAALDAGAPGAQLYVGMFGASDGDFLDATQALMDEYNHLPPGTRQARRAKMIAFFKKHPKDFRSWKETKDGITVVCGSFPVTLFDNRDPELPDAG